jgi:FecR protein
MRPRFLMFAMAGTILLAPAGAIADPIGDVVSVVPQANYQRSGAVQELSINDLVEQNDRVITTGDGSAYIHFIDDTVLTVGANSEVLLDKFVFDGDKARTAVIQITRGTLRFVTGTSDHSAYQIKTPVATIGVRGTTIDVSYENDRMLCNTVQGAGEICHASAGCQQMRAGAAPLAINRAGFSLATPAEAARMLNVITRSHNVLAQRIGRNPGNMLAFAKDRGRWQGLMAQKGFKGLEPKGFGPKGFEQKGLGQKLQPNLGQKPGFLQKLIPGGKWQQKKKQDQQ